MLGPKRAWIEVDDDAVTVHMGWAFNARFPRSAATEVLPEMDRYYSMGAHGWRGKWLVNGSQEGLVRLSIDPSADVSATTCGIGIKLHTLIVSVEEPDAFIAEFV